MKLSVSGICQGGLINDMKVVPACMLCRHVGEWRYGSLHS